MTETPAHSDEADLLKRIAERDQTALSGLYDRLGGWVYSLALSVVGDRPDAEEVTQEVFLSIWRQADRYVARRGSVRAWLAIMTRNLAIDHTRSRAYRARHRNAPNDPEATAAVGTHSAEGMAATAEMQFVEKAMQRLEDNHRQLLHLSYYQGYSHREIAKKLDMPLGTVKSRLRDGVNKLRELLEIKV